MNAPDKPKTGLSENPVPAPEKPKPKDPVEARYGPFPERHPELLDVTLREGAEIIATMPGSETLPPAPEPPPGKSGESVR